MYVQGAVVAGVYTRGAIPCPTSLSDVGATTSCRRVRSDDDGGCHESPAAVSTVACIGQCPSVTVVPSHSSATTATSTSSTQLSPASAADVSATLSLPATSQQPVPPPLCSPPVKTGILPPAAYVNVNTTATAPLSVAQTDKDWKEFEEVLSEEFVSFSSLSAAEAASCHQSMDASFMQPQQPMRGRLPQPQQPMRGRVPSLMMPSTALLLFTLYI